ncbi:MAG: hypothetical protein AUJ23_00275 [Candidatus Magasanikbacteria bacterium CG1_02_32_51]|uniref:Uncharacterized protein n=1 Tax=Candidatus Magasanikbacteria bacterium CG1_02_32_51 TaxID=1805238 RepID=A0A1J4UCJ3_9BACT|nr:MAG: hypothetical protein AUJ23_00275 [Candidatus Magasanikbacteria bacterium CG1_02_32_51]
MIPIVEKIKTKIILNQIKEKKSLFWEKVGQKNTLKLFKKAAQYVPAYKDFLLKNGIDYKKIKIWSDFESVPIIDKKNYLQQYPLEALCWNGRIDKPLIFTSTSGSTGNPFYFPRNHQIDWQSAVTHQQFYNQYASGSTLVIVTFGMGIWIGGLITYQAFEIIARNGKKPISIITPGINKKEIFKALHDLAPKYGEVILVGYPPFIKDLLDEAKTNDVDLKKIKMRFVMAAEVFTENFRDYLVEQVGNSNIFTDFMHIYGSADIGTMAAEFAPGVLVKRLANQNQLLFEDLFEYWTKSPTLAQYNPNFINFEQLDGQLLLSGDNTMPLIRYAIGDRGGVYSYEQIKNKFTDFGIDLEKEAKSRGLLPHWQQLPFVYIFERMDLSVTFYGVNIYPQIIREVLLDDHLQKYITSKFTLQTKFTEKQDQYLEIVLELKSQMELPVHLHEVVKGEILSALVEKSSEFRELFKLLGERACLSIKFLPFEHPEYFKPGIKQKWIIK